MSYMLLHVYLRSAMNTSADKHFSCHPFAKTIYIPLQGVICDVIFSFSGTFNSRIGLYPHNHVSNCQQEAILKSHLSKILRAYSREDNHFQKEVRWAWLEHSRYASSSGSCWLLQAWQAAIKSVLVQQAKSWFNSWFTTSYFLKHQFLIPGKQHRVTVKHL